MAHRRLSPPNRPPATSVRAQDFSAHLAHLARLARIEVDTDAHPVVNGIVDFEVHDERYSWLRVAPQVRGLAWHEHDGVRHPLLWTHHYGGALVVYDALGHDERSYQSAARRSLVSRAARWLVGDLQPRHRDADAPLALAVP